MTVSYTLISMFCKRCSLQTGGKVGKRRGRGAHDSRVPGCPPGPFDLVAWFTSARQGRWRRGRLGIDGGRLVAKRCET